MSRLFITLLCGLMSVPVLGQDVETQQQRPLVQVDVSVEMDAVNEALDSTSKSIEEISDSFRVIAEGGQLDPEQQQHLETILENLDHVVGATRTSVDALPSLVKNSRHTVTEQISEFFADLKFWSITILVILSLVLIIAIICFYYFIVRPLQKSLLEITGNIRDMAKAMENTSKSLEISNQTHRELLKMNEAKGNM